MNNLTPVERGILEFALERVEDAMSNEPDEFTGEEHDALDSLKARLAGKA